MWGSPYVRTVAAALHQAKVDYEFKFVNVFTGEHKQEEFLKINPFGQVPAFTDGNFSLAESGAILRYVCDKYDLGDWYPQDPKLRANVDAKACWIQYTILPALNSILSVKFLPGLGLG